MASDEIGGKVVKEGIIVVTTGIGAVLGSVAGPAGTVVGGAVGRIFGSLMTSNEGSDNHEPPYSPM